jgi:DNA polymerase phi
MSLVNGEPKWIPQGLMTKADRDMCKLRLESYFGELTKPRDVQYYSDLVLCFRPTGAAMDKTIKAAEQNALRQLQYLSEAALNASIDEKGRATYKALTMLQALAIFQLYQGEPSALDMLSELHVCQENLEDSEFDASAFISETVLSLIAQKSTLTKQIAHQVFALCVSHNLTLAGLDILLQTLGTEESIEGYNTIFKPEDDDSDQEFDSDVEIVEKGEDDDGEDADEDQGVDGDETPDTTDGDDPELAALDDALAGILRSHRLDQDKGADTSEDDSDMSDSEMISLDDKISAAFRSERSRLSLSHTKKERERAVREVREFKFKVLELLSTYVKQVPNAAYSVTILPALVHLMGMTKHHELAKRASDIVAAYDKTTSKLRMDAAPSATSDQVEELFKLLQDIHQEVKAVEQPSTLFLKAASSASLMTVWALGGKQLTRVSALYAETRTVWQQQQRQVQPDSTVFFVRWYELVQDRVGKAPEELIAF